VSLFKRKKKAEPEQITVSFRVGVQDFEEDPESWEPFIAFRYPREDGQLFDLIFTPHWKVYATLEEARAAADAITDMFRHAGIPLGEVKK